MGNTVKTFRKKEIYQQMPDMVRRNGYPLEEHRVVTSDGYRLTLHRIPRRGGDAPASGGRAVLVQHGLLCDSAVFAIAGPGKGLAYLLSDRGHDVWLGNSRGTRYSRDHDTLSPDSPDGKYWQFSWHEMGVFDLPAVTDYILNTTQKPQLTYVGYSQGCTQFFVMGSEKPEYNRKIEAMFGLAPAVYLSHARNVVFRDPWRTMFLSFLGGRFALYKADSMEDLVRRSLAKYQFSSKACINLINIMAGEDKQQLDMAVAASILSVFPSTAASRQLTHYEQLYLSGGFHRFDHGTQRNLEQYGSARPPDYDLGKVSCPVTLYYGLNDHHVDPADVKKTYEQLGNPAGIVAVPYPKFNHVDFLWAKDVKTLLYDDLLSRIDNSAAESQPSAVTPSVGRYRANGAAIKEVV